MSDYTDNIKRIVGIDALTSRLKALEDKAPINGRRSVVYGAEGSPNTSSASGDLVKTGVNALASAATKAALAALADTAVTEAANTATGDATNAAKSGTTPPAGVVKASTDGVQSALNYFNGVGNDGIGDTLSGISGFKNLAGTKNVDLRLDGTYVSPKGFTPGGAYDIGNDYIGFIQGYRWYDGDTYYPTGEQALMSYFSKNWPSWEISSYYMISSIRIHADGIETTPPNYGHPVAGEIQATACILGDASCLVSAPSRDWWPTSDTIQLSQNRFVAQSLIPSATGFSTHPRDARNTPPDLAGIQSTIELTFSGGTRNAKIEPNNIGGSIISEINPATKAYIGTSRIYDGNGMLAAYADSTTVANYRP